MCFFKRCGLLEGLWYLENARTCLLSVWGWPFGAFGVVQILLWGPGIKADCSEGELICMHVSVEHLGKSDADLSFYVSLPPKNTL